MAQTEVKRAPWLTKRYMCERELKRFPLSNEDIWICTIAAIQQKGGNRFLKFRDGVDMLENLSSVYRNWNIPVSEVIRNAGVEDLDNDKFLSRVCFNYDYKPGFEQRAEEAWDQLQRGQRRSIDWNSPELISIEQFGKRVFTDLNTRDVKVGEIFNRETLSPETVFKLRGYNAPRAERIILNTLAFFPIAGLLIRIGAGADETEGWEHNSVIRRFYGDKVIPFIDDNELIRARNRELGRDAAIVTREV